MSKKRTSPESSNNDEQTKEDLDSVFQQDNSAKRARLSSLSDKTLQDLPIEIIQCILVKAVAMEVKGKRLAKRAWKEEADLVISRLRTVCSQWSSILSTDFFRSELQRTLDGTALGTVRMEILHQSPLDLPPSLVNQLITLKDEVFMLCIADEEHSVVINVYNRNNMAEVKDVIPLSGINPACLTACSVSNCLYILNRGQRDHISIQRITKEDEHQYSVSPVIIDKWLPNATLSVTANGNLILSSQQRSKQVTIITVYDANGSSEREVRMTSNHFLEFYQVIPKSNGNLVLVSADERQQTQLTEIDMDGNVQRQYYSPLDAYSGTCEADIYGRILIAERLNSMELLDSEFNRLDFTAPQLDENQDIYCDRMHYDSERNEVVAIVEDKDSENGVLTIFRFAEE